MSTLPLVSWLLSSTEPALRWRTRRELLDLPDSDPLVAADRAALPDAPTARALLAGMRPDGTWQVRHYRTKEWIGADVRYADFSTTHFVLSYLAELGLDRSHPAVTLAAERYLALQRDDGDWADAGSHYTHFSCLLGQNLRTFTRLGYRADPHIQRALDLLLATERPDGGYLCDMHEGRYATRAVKSCIRGSVKVLLALAELPETWSHPRASRLVDYFLERGGIYRRGTRTLVNRDMAATYFPTTWRANIWEVLYALSVMGYGADERLADAWMELDKHRAADGAYILDWTPAKPWAAGVRGQPNEWVTLYALLAKKYAGKLDKAEQICQVG
ncbi:MAG: hypothetical protein LLG44_02920 [Chloroflexi bacterium]|nr:hypothetical protein [Chloroflexota bacterium]